MKKIVLSLITILFFQLFYSCSNNDDNSITPILPTQVIETVEYNGNTEIYTANITYDGNKMVRQDYGLDIVDLTYTGDLITKFEYKRNNVVIQRNEYTYDNNERLINYKRFEFDDIIGDYGTNVNYDYNTDGSVNFTRYSGYLPNLNLSSSGTITLNQENLVSTIAFSNGDSYAYSYDTKNNPFKNILGVDKIPFEDDEANSFFRNYISIDKTNSGFSYTTSFIHNYNSNDYPGQTIENDGYEIVTTQYIYNQ